MRLSPCRFKLQEGRSEHPSWLAAARLLVGTAWLWLLVVLPFITDAACSWLLWPFLAGSGIVVGVIWFPITAAEPRLLRLRRIWWWASVPLVGVLAVLLQIGDLGLTARVFLCEAQLNHYIAEVQPGAGHDCTARRVGLFSVDKTQIYSNGAVYFFTSQSFLNSHGVAYVPEGVGAASRMSLRRLYGCWCRFDWRF
jgi:hypothetical protein